MGHRVIHVDLTKARQSLPDLLVRENPDAERRLALDVGIERDFRSGKQANRDIRLANASKSARNGVVEFGHDQLVLYPGRPGRHVVKTIVTHRQSSFLKVAWCVLP